MINVLFAAKIEQTPVYDGKFVQLLQRVYDKDGSLIEIYSG
jgi:hypothetical protein